MHIVVVPVFGCKSFALVINNHVSRKFINIHNQRGLYKCFVNGNIIIPLYDDIGMHITWLGHSTFLIETENRLIYIDPYLDPHSSVRLPKAHFILISHWHPDHCTRESVQKLMDDDTIIIGTAEAAREFNGAIPMRAGEKRQFGNLTIKAMPARTLHHAGGHSEEGFVIGFVIESEKKKLYYTSDTDPLPEMVGLMPDVVIIPVGGSTTMGAQEAAKAVSAMQAKIAIPAHWGTTTGTRDDAELFKEYVETGNQRVVILEPGEMTEL
jgi:L-ascorbate metabolism protein UlaG (beta-lactamase superfamily)